MPNILFIGQVSDSHILANIKENKSVEFYISRDLLTDFKVLRDQLIIKIGWKHENNHFSGFVTILSQEEDKIKVLLNSYICYQQPKVGFELILSVCRPQMMKRIFEVLPCFSVSKVYLTKSALSEASYLGSNLIKRGELNKLIHKGIQQSGRPISLEYEVFNNLNSLHKKLILEESISNKNDEEKILKLVFHPEGEKINKIKSMFLEKTKIILAVGPESGWDKKEISTFNSYNFKSVSISDSIFRVDSAVISSLSKMELMISC